jgi:hypothetical protein
VETTRHRNRSVKSGERATSRRPRGADWRRVLVVTTDGPGGRGPSAGATASLGTLRFTRVCCQRIGFLRGMKWADVEVAERTLFQSRRTR